MAWRPQALFDAFARHGILAQGIYKPGASALPFVCDLQQPDVLVLGEQHQTTSYEIEYETASVPTMREGDLVQITWLGTTAQYRVRNAPNTQGSGYYSKAELTKV